MLVVGDLVSARSLFPSVADPSGGVLVAGGARTRAPIASRQPLFVFPLGGGRERRGGREVLVELGKKTRPLSCDCSQVFI